MENKGIKMKRILFIIVLCTFALAQVPDSVIVQKMADIKAEYDKNEETIKTYEARQIFLNAQHIALFDLIKEEEVEEKE